MNRCTRLTWVWVCRIYVGNLIGKRKKRKRFTRYLKVGKSSPACTYTFEARSGIHYERGLYSDLKIVSVYVDIFRARVFAAMHFCDVHYVYARFTIHLHTVRNAIKDFSGREPVFTIVSKKLGVKYLAISRYRP